MKVKSAPPLNPGIGKFMTAEDPPVRSAMVWCSRNSATIPGRSLFLRKSRTFIRCTVPLPWYRLTAAAEAAASQEEYHDVLFNILHSVQADFAGIPQFPGNES